MYTRLGDFMEESKKLEMITEETKRLTKLFHGLSVEEFGLAEGLIEEAAYMKVTLEELKETINHDGAVDVMPQGSYSIKREHPALKSYNTMVNRYSSITSQLTRMLPEEEQEDVEENGFEKFVKLRDVK